MNREKHAKTVSLGQLHHWLKENNHLTWNMNGFYGEGGFGGKGSPVIKYVFPYLDMRDGMIYHIETQGFGKYVVDFREEFDGNLLELLKYKIENKISLPKDQSGDDYVHELMVNRFNKEKENGTP